MFNFKGAVLLLGTLGAGYYFYGDMLEQELPVPPTTSQVVASEASPTVYKCQDSNGSITYSQIACPNSDELVEQLKVGRSKANSDKHAQCGLVRNFAAEAGIAVYKKVDVDKYMARYGGEQNLDPIATKIVRSVFSFQSQSYRTIENSIYYESERCMSGEYGDPVPVCAQFPGKFVQSYGNCKKASSTELRVARISPYLWGGKEKNQAKKSSNQVFYVSRNKTKTTEAPSRCVRDLRKDLARNKADAKAARGAGAHDFYREERRSLEKRLKNC